MLPLAWWNSGTDGALGDMNFTVSETVEILDRVALVQEDRNVDQGARELLELSESVVVDKSLTVSETVEILDRVALDEISRDVDQGARELLAISESVTVDEIPEIASAEIDPSLDEDHPGERIRCRFTTGASCESVWVDRNIDGAGWVGHQQVNTSPSTGPYVSNWYNGTTGETVQFRVRPFSQDSQAGTEGSAVSTGTVEIGLE